MYPGSLLTVLASFVLLADAEVVTGRNWIASGAGQALISAPNRPARYCRRHLNNMLVFSP